MNKLINIRSDGLKRIDYTFIVLSIVIISYVLFVPVYEIYGVWEGVLDSTNYHSLWQRSLFVSLIVIMTSSLFLLCFLRPNKFFWSPYLFFMLSIVSITLLIEEDRNKCIFMAGHKYTIWMYLLVVMLIIQAILYSIQINEFRFKKNTNDSSS
jgi:hypothetical protein